MAGGIDGGGATLGGAVAWNPWWKSCASAVGARLGGGPTVGASGMAAIGPGDALAICDIGMWG
ncbi:MAG: hypothetical protein WA317_13685, partial [Mycobacterium sp.]|uniref:hypothetical protein n=1 Tax=Mycobacterium sp. TaxID=1785 RepID=UPI003CC68C3F